MKSNSVFRHFRKKYGYKKDFTVAITTERSNNTIGIGFSFVSEKDQFCRKIGRAISLGRAKLTKDSRTIGIPTDVLNNYKGTVDFLRTLVKAAERFNLKDKDQAPAIYDAFIEGCNTIINQ